MKKIRILSPLFLLLIIESLGLTAVIAFSDAPITSFSVTVSLIILATGLLPALLRPGKEHILAGALATIFSAFLLIPFNPPLNTILKIGLQPKDISSYLLFRFFNGAGIGSLFLHLTSRFPRRSSLSGRVLAFCYGVSATLLIAFFALSQPIFKKWIFLAMVIWLFVQMGWGITLLLRVSRDPAPEHRRSAQQARLLLFSFLIANSGLLIRLWLMTLQDRTIPYTYALVPQIFLPIGITYAIMKHDLFDIDAALRRGLAYGSLSLILLAGYLGITVILTAVLTQNMPQFRGVAAAISVLIAAAAFEPLRKRLQYWIDRWLYPDRLNFYHAIEDARANLSQVVKQKQVIALLTEELPQKIGAEWGTLSLAPAPDVSGHSESEPSWNERLIVGGTSLGRYWLGARQAGPSFDKDERSQLSSLVGQAALALAYADTIEALNTLNRQLESRVEEGTEQVLSQQRTLAALEERQRLARDLHDNVTQTLFSINLSARAIRGLLKKNVKNASDELLGLENAAQTALEEMRSLLAQLRNTAETVPSPKLVDFSRKLEELCTELYKKNNLNITIKQANSLLLSSSLADEALLIIKEALQNTAKHSGVLAAKCIVVHEGNTLHLSVMDRGYGFLPEKLQHTDRHFGLRGMKERVSKLSGKIEIISELGAGTMLKVQIPLKKDVN